MKAQTKAYGEIEIDDRQRILFPRGLLGFEKFKEYALMDAPQKPFFYLQSLELPELAFVLIDPFLFRSDYSIDINDRDLAQIELSNPEEALVFSIVTVPGDGQAVTANLMGPLVVNKKNRLAVQTVLSDPRWFVKHDIMAEMAKGGS